MPSLNPRGQTNKKNNHKSEHTRRILFRLQAVADALYEIRQARRHHLQHCITTPLCVWSHSTRCCTARGHRVSWYPASGQFLPAILFSCTGLSIPEACQLSSVFPRPADFRQHSLRLPTSVKFCLLMRERLLLRVLFRSSPQNKKNERRVRGLNPQPKLSRSDVVPFLLVHYITTLPQHYTITSLHRQYYYATTPLVYSMVLPHLLFGGHFSSCKNKATA